MATKDVRKKLKDTQNAARAANIAYKEKKLSGYEAMMKAKREKGAAFHKELTGQKKKAPTFSGEAGKTKADFTKPSNAEKLMGGESKPIAHTVTKKTGYGLGTKHEQVPVTTKRKSAGTAQSPKPKSKPKSKPKEKKQRGAVKVGKHGGKYYMTPAGKKVYVK